MSERATAIPTLTLCEVADTGAPGIESYSPFCLKVHRALRLCGLRYQRRHGATPASFKQYNPARQVPVLLVDDQPVFDSTRILLRLDELSGGALTRGLDPRARAEAWLWEELADASLSGFVVAARWADDDNWPRARDAFFVGLPALVRPLVAGGVRRGVMARLRARDVWRAGPEACWASLQHVLDRLEGRAPGARWWLGETISVADIALFAQLHSLRTALTPWQAEQVAARKKLSAWLDRVQDATAGDRAATEVTIRGPAHTQPSRNGQVLASTGRAE